MGQKTNAKISFKIDFDFMKAENYFYFVFGNLKN